MIPRLKGRRLGVWSVGVIGLIVLVATTSAPVSLATFTGQHGASGVLGTKAIFPNIRRTPAFVVIDASSGTEVNRSSPFLAAGDGLSMTTSAWATAFDGSRYVEFDLNGPLAGGVAVSGATFNFSLASSGSGQVCFYFEVRRASTTTTLATHGTSGSPVGCVTGTAAATFATPIASVASTDIANDLRIRVYGAESAAASMVVDLATVSGATAYQTFTLYPVVYRDAADTTPESVPWSLALP